MVANYTHNKVTHTNTHTPTLSRKYTSHTRHPRAAREQALPPAACRVHCRQQDEQLLVNESDWAAFGATERIIINFFAFWNECDSRVFVAYADPPRRNASSAHAQTQAET